MAWDPRVVWERFIDSIAQLHRMVYWSGGPIARRFNDPVMDLIAADRAGAARTAHQQRVLGIHGCASERQRRGARLDEGRAVGLHGCIRSLRGILHDFANEYGARVADTVRGSARRRWSCGRRSGPRALGRSGPSSWTGYAPLSPAHAP
jgi:hypothetical protein